MSLKANATMPALPAFLDTLKQGAPESLLKATKRAFQRIGRFDLAKLRREQLQGGAGLNVKAATLAGAFKAKVSGANVAGLTLQEYVGWKAAQIFEQGGTINPAKRQGLAVLLPAAYAAGGKRMFNAQTLPGMIASGELAIIRTAKGTYIIRKLADQTQFMAKIVRTVHERKRLDFFGNFENNGADHDRILGEEADKAVAAMAAPGSGGR